MAQSIEGVIKPSHLKCRCVNRHLKQGKNFSTRFFWMTNRRPSKPRSRLIHPCFPIEAVTMFATPDMPRTPVEDVLAPAPTKPAFSSSAFCFFSAFRLVSNLAKKPSLLKIQSQTERAESAFSLAELSRVSSLSKASPIRASKSITFSSEQLRVRAGLSGWARLRITLSQQSVFKSLKEFAKHPIYSILVERADIRQRAS